MNAQISFQTRPVLAALLLVVLSASVVLAKGNDVSFKGSFDGRETAMVQGGMLTVNGSGAGTASHIGRFTYTMTATVDLATGLSSGAFRLLAPNGDEVYGSFVGRGRPTDTLNVEHIMELMAITGGTGRFQGAKGDFTFDRLIDQTTLPEFSSTSGSLKGTINTPRSTR